MLSYAPFYLSYTHTIQANHFQFTFVAPSSCLLLSASWLQVLMQLLGITRLSDIIFPLSQFCHRFLGLFSFCCILFLPLFYLSVSKPVGLLTLTSPSDEWENELRGQRRRSNEQNMGGMETEKEKERDGQTLEFCLAGRGKYSPND